MIERYLNYHTKTADSRWDRHSFANHWWDIYRDDPHWVPPYYPQFRQALEPGKNEYLKNLRPQLLQISAIARQSSTKGESGNMQMGPGVIGMGMERTVAAALLFFNSRRDDRKAYLAELKSVNERESLNRLLYFAREKVQELGCQGFIGPIGLAPHLGSGLLMDHWDLMPPLHTAYNPPYLPELLSRKMEPLEQAGLYILEVPAESYSPDGPAQLSPLEPSRLSSDLLSLFKSGCPDWQHFPEPNQHETAFILNWIAKWPLIAWLARMDNEAAGFLLLQPDLAPLLDQAGGGRNIFWRIWLNWRRRKPVQHGRILFGGVRERWRGKGIGKQLLQQALLTARQQGWSQLSIGPIPENSNAGAFLRNQGSRLQQHYQIFQWG